MMVQFTGGSLPSPVPVSWLSEVDYYTPRTADLVVSWAGANPALNYTLMMIDRDAPSALTPIRAPIRHWVKTDVSGASLQMGVSPDNNTDLTPFRPPGVRVTCIHFLLRCCLV